MIVSSARSSLLFYFTGNAAKLREEQESGTTGAIVRSKAKQRAIQAVLDVTAKWVGTRARNANTQKLTSAFPVSDPCVHSPAPHTHPVTPPATARPELPCTTSRSSLGPRSPELRLNCKFEGQIVNARSHLGGGPSWPGFGFAMRVNIEDNLECKHSQAHPHGNWRFAIRFYLLSTVCTNHANSIFLVVVIGRTTSK